MRGQEERRRSEVYRGEKSKEKKKRGVAGREGSGGERRGYQIRDTWT